MPTLSGQQAWEIKKEWHISTLKAKPGRKIDLQSRSQIFIPILSMHHWHYTSQWLARETYSQLRLLGFLTLLPGAVPNSRHTSLITMTLGIT